MYFAAQRKSAVTAAQRESTGSIALLYSSRWRTPDSARTFVRVYSAQMARKYERVVRRQKDEKDDSEQVYSTEEGDVLISMSGSGVFIGEGFSLPLARKLRDNIAALQSDAPLRLAGADGHELSLGMVRGLAGFGLMKVAAEPTIYLKRR
jgi:hypothetical protein